MKNFNKILLICGAIMLSGCSQIKQCDTCNNQCESNKTCYVLNLDNYLLYLQVESTYLGSFESSDYYCLNLKPSLSYALYDCVEITYKPINSTTDEIFTLNLDLGGYGKSDSFKFDIQNIKENLKLFNILSVKGHCLY